MARILLVDDEPSVRAPLARALQIDGHAVQEAIDGADALEKLTGDETGFDLMISDIRMPVMDGLEATRAIRTLDRTDAVQVPIIALSANAFETDTQNAIQAGMTAYLSKPIEVEKLFTTLSEVLR